MGNLCSEADRWASQNPVESTSPIPGSILIGNPLAIAIGKTVCMHRRNGLETMCDRLMESNFFLSSAAEASPSMEISQSSSEWPGRGRHFRWRSARAACLVMYTSLCPPCSSLMLHVLMSVKSKSQANARYGIVPPAYAFYACAMTLGVSGFLCGRLRFFAVINQRQSTQR